MKNFYLLCFLLNSFISVSGQSLSSFIQLSSKSYVDLTTSQRQLYDMVDSQKVFSNLFLVEVDTAAINQAQGLVLVHIPSVIDSIVYKSFYVYSDTADHLAWNGNTVRMEDTNVVLAGQMSLIFQNGLIGNFWKDSLNFQLYSLGSNQYLLGKYKKPSIVDNICGDDSASATFTPTPTPCHYNTTKVLFIFDSTATAQEPNLQLKAQQCLNAVNTIWAQSNVYNHAFLAGAVSYDLQSIYTLDENYFNNVMEEYTLGYITDANINNIRVQYRADIVIFMVGADLYREIGYAKVGATNPLHAGMVVSSLALHSDYFLFAHEFNHIYNCRHPRQEEDFTFNDYYNYNHGFLFNDKGTLMGHDAPLSYTKIPYLSNPQLTYAGQPIGESTYSNNARMANEWKDHIASYFTDYVPISAQMSIAQPAKCAHTGTATVTVSCGEQPYSYQWFYSDNGINWNSFGGSSASQSITVPYSYSVFGGTYNSRQFKVKVTDLNGDEAWAYGTGYYNCPDVGISFSPLPLATNNKQLLVSPNPSLEGRIEVRIQGYENEYVQLSILDMSGKVMGQLFKGLALEGMLIIYNHSHLPAGTYLIKISENSNTEKVQKIIIK